MKWTIFVFLGLSAWTCVAAECRAPRYRKGHVWEDSPATLMMNISIQTRDFAPERLVCLAEALKQRYSRKHREILIYVFSSYPAAKNYTKILVGDSVGKPPIDWGAQHHATYSFNNANEGKDHVTIFPNESREFSTKIDLPAKILPPCTLALAGRCLLTLDRVWYPWDAWKVGYSGTVTIEGVIDEDGRMKDIKVAGAAAPPGEAQSILNQAALQNLISWRLEPANRQDPIRITYDYECDPSLGPPNRPLIRYDLPHRIEIRGRKVK